ncbi:signal peptide peptidase SppA [Methanothermococcus sp.]|uniref:signal peptide peptidase SppA n=1 Tax=Methanothermococcus sp. TaxID=2614238 RepID=UPI0025FBA15A|nr:signal peptide peptidase SppA [Methanothermococcus sp.]
MKKIYLFACFIFVLIIVLVVAIGVLLIPYIGSGGIFESNSGNIAVINIDNMLVLNSKSSLFGDNEPSVKDYIESLDSAEHNANIKAIILKINCPGGEVIASEKLARKVKEVSKEKPVVAYIETLGTSGAYMAIAPANYIVAEKHSIVGSIGVRMDIIHYYGLMKKLGVNVTVIKAGKYKDIGSPYRPMTPEEKTCLEKMINETYMDFVEWVAENRNMSINKTLKIANGRIYSGIDAKKVGLVDAVGTETDAVHMAAKIANISNPKTVEYTPSKSVGILNIVSSMAYDLGYGIGKGFGETEKSNIINMY